MNPEHQINRFALCCNFVRRTSVVLTLLGTSNVWSLDTVLAQEGRRSPEADAGPRVSEEVEGRRSPEAEAGPQRSAEGQRRDTVKPEAGRDGQGLRDFKPQTDREAVLYKMIQQLQREVAALRNEVRSSGRGDRSDSERGVRDGNPSRERTASRETDGAATGYKDFRLVDNWRNSKEGRVFKAYDKNSDEIVSLEEWLAMTNGNISDARRAICTKHFNDAEPSGDGEFTPAEFIWWRQIGSRQAAARARESRTRDGEGEKCGPRDGEQRRSGRRDGERE